MNDKKFEKLLNKEADKYAREYKDAVMKNCGVETKKQKPAILSALPAVAAVVFLFAFAVICYIPVALKNNGTSSGTETAETTDTDGIYTQDFGKETSVTEETETMFDKSETETTMEIITQNNIYPEYSAIYVEYISRVRNGEILNKNEIDELTKYIDNNYFGIDLEYARASDDERKAIAEERGVDEATMNAYILLWTDAENIGKLEYYGYPKMTIQKICDIINESENFDEIIRKIGETDKFLSQVWQKTTGKYGYRYDFRSSEDNCYEYIDVYPADNSIMYHKVINDRNSKEYHYNYAVYLWNKDIEEGENHHITTDQIKDNLRLWNNDF